MVILATLIKTWESFKKAIEYHERRSKNCQRSGRQGWGRLDRILMPWCSALNLECSPEEGP